MKGHVSVEGVADHVSDWLGLYELDGSVVMVWRQDLTTKLKSSPREQKKGGLGGVTDGKPGEQIVSDWVEDDLHIFYINVLYLI